MLFFERKPCMKLLEDKILNEGRVLPGDVLKVDNFLNHQIDVELVNKLGEEWYRLFKDEGITKILTIEASGIGIACLAAQHFGVPVLFAKKSKSSNIGSDFYTTKVTSYTHGQVYDVIVSKKYISENDRVLVIDDFLANGCALKALIELAKMSGATVVGAGVAIEKAYQGGGDEVRKMGYRVESLARIAAMNDGKIEFC